MKEVFEIKNIRSIKIVPKIFLLTIIIMLHVSCSSLFSGNNTNEMSGKEGLISKKEIKDVSQKARLNSDLEPRKRLMILPFLDATNAKDESGTYLNLSSIMGGVSQKARMDFIKELNRSGELVVVDSKDLNIDLNSAKTSDGQNYKTDSIALLAKDLGVAAILEGKLIDVRVKRKSDEVGLFRSLKSQFDCVAQIRIVSARSGKEIFNTTKTVTIEESATRVAENVQQDKFFKDNPEILSNLVKETFLDFQPQILLTMSKLSWEGRIAVVKGDRIYLNVGRLSGLQMGDILKVSDEGEDVYDPQTGNFIGKVPGRLKGTLEVVSYFGQDGAIAIIHSGSGFKENDKIELY